MGYLPSDSTGSQMYGVSSPVIAKRSTVGAHISGILTMTLLTCRQREIAIPASWQDPRIVMHSVRAEERTEGRARLFDLHRHTLLLGLQQLRK
jgi:hypothetical protein